jgi:hypothetical protein
VTEISLKMSYFPAFVSRQQAGMAIRGLSDALRMKNFKESGTSGEIGCRLTRNRDAKMEIPE